MAGVAAALLFVAWGYIDRRDTPEALVPVVHALAFVVPTLFMAVVVGICLVLRSRLGVLGWAGLVLTVFGWAISLVRAVAGADAMWAFIAPRGWSPLLQDWLFFVLGGLTLVGIATARGKPFGGMGGLVLATGALGWGYYLTNVGDVLEHRTAQVGFGLLFGLGWLVLGVRLSAAGARRGEDLGRKRLGRIPPMD